MNVINDAVITTLERALRDTSSSSSSIAAVCLLLEDAMRDHPKETARALRNVVKSAQTAEAKWSAWCVLDAVVKLPASPSVDACRTEIIKDLQGGGMLAQIAKWEGVYVDLPRSWWDGNVFAPGVMASLSEQLTQHIERQKANSFSAVSTATAEKDIRVVAGRLETKQAQSKQAKVGENVMTFVAHMYDSLNREVCTHCSAPLRDRESRDRHGRMHFYYRESGKTFQRLYSPNMEAWVNHVRDDGGTYVRTLTTTSAQTFVELHSKKRARGAEAEEGTISVIDPTVPYVCMMCKESMSPVLEGGTWVLRDAVRVGPQGGGLYAHKGCSGV